MDIIKEARKIKEAINKAKYPVALTGAGISVGSGLPTFDIEWRGIPIRSVLTREFFESNKETFFDLFRDLVKWNDVKPNAAHIYLAQQNVSIITQNIDGLHQKAGSKKVFELHGSMRDLICRECGKRYPVNIVKEQNIPKCKCGEELDTDVVLFGDMIHDWSESIAESEKCDLMLVIGTSLQVAPANLLPEIAKNNNAEIIIINKEAEHIFDELLKL